MLRIDHVILGTRDLDQAAERLRSKHGLDSYVGGVHPEWGTGNRIVPLGEGYLEIMGIVEPALALQNPLGRFIESHTADGDRLIAWCLRSDALEDDARRRDTTVVPGGRRLPDGSELTWRLAGLERALAEPPLPFFITWDDEATTPGHRGTPAGNGIAWIELSGGAATLGDYVADGSVPYRVVDGAPSVRRVAITTPAGEIVVD